MTKNAVLTILIRLLAITVLVYAAVQIWYGKMEKDLQKQESATRVVQTQPVGKGQRESQAGSSPAEEIRAIMGRNIFQLSLEENGRGNVPSATADIDTLEKTKLSLSLLGTVSGDRDDARAIIRDDKTRLEDLYRVGSTIQGATISRITRGKVVLLVNGQEEALVIKDRDEAPGAGPVRRRTPVTLNTKTEETVRAIPKAVPRRRFSFRSSSRARVQENPRELVEAPMANTPAVLEESEQQEPNDAAEFSDAEFDGEEGGEPGQGKAENN